MGYRGRRALALGARPHLGELGQDDEIRCHVPNENSPENNLGETMTRNRSGECKRQRTEAQSDQEAHSKRSDLFRQSLCGPEARIREGY